MCLRARLGASRGILAVVTGTELVGPDVSGLVQRRYQARA